MDTVWFIMELIVRLFELLGIGTLIVIFAHEAGANKKYIEKIFKLLFEYELDTEDIDVDELII